MKQSETNTNTNLKFCFVLNANFKFKTIISKLLQKQKSKFQSCQKQEKKSLCIDDPIAVCVYVFTFPMIIGNIR